MEWLRELYTMMLWTGFLTDVNAKGTGIISSYSNVYDVAAMITKKTFQMAHGQPTAYDSLNRLLEETNKKSTSIVYDYVYTMIQ